MAKEIGSFIIIIKGTKAAGPQSMTTQYIVQDSGDNDLKKQGVSDNDSPSLNKTFHNSGTTGELWYDEIAAVETAEGI